MACIKTSEHFEIYLQDTLAYSHEEFGEVAAKRFYEEYQKIRKRLEKHPLSSPKEPLLKSFYQQYRSAIIRKNWKIIYRYDDERDRVTLLDLWDMRRNPRTLVREFRRRR